MVSQNTILVVDDSPVLRRISSAIAKRLGFEVMEATCGQDAIQLFASHQKAICLIVIDFEMPGLNGVETILQLRQIPDNGKDIPILLYSTVPMSAVPFSFFGDSNCEFVDKNHGTEELTLALNRWLGA